MIVRLCVPCAPLDGLTVAGNKTLLATPARAMQRHGGCCFVGAELAPDDVANVAGVHDEPAARANFLSDDARLRP